jgi:hypothetical protein
MLAKEYTIPYFPDIVDVNMHPLPWTFLGSKENYYERTDGRLLGIRMSQYVQQDRIDPLQEVSSEKFPALANEVARMEQTKLKSSLAIAFLTPSEGKS